MALLLIFSKYRYVIRNKQSSVLRAFSKYFFVAKSPFSLLPPPQYFKDSIRSPFESRTSDIWLRFPVPLFNMSSPSWIVWLFDSNVHATAAVWGIIPLSINCSTKIFWSIFFSVRPISIQKFYLIQLVQSGVALWQHQSLLVIDCEEIVKIAELLRQVFAALSAYLWVMAL